MSVVSTGTPSGSSARSGKATSRPVGAPPDLPPAVKAAPTTCPTGAPVTPGGQLAVIGEPLAEAAVLGCVLRATPEQARAVLGLLDEDCWSVPQHAHVAAAARTLLARGEPADPVTVLGQLRRQGTENARTSSRDAGVFLVGLCEAAPTLGSAGYYARIVLEHAYRRRVQAAGLRLLDAADAADLTALMQLVDREYAAVSRARQRAATGPLRDLPPS